LTVQSGGVFDLNSQSNLFNTLDLAGTGISAGGALINSASGTTSILAANVNLTANSSMGGVGNLSIPNVISGSGFGLTKVGGGTATLSGANTYTGNTTVNAGTLEIVNPVIATNSTVTVASGAVLKLDFAVTNTVTALVLNGASQSAGVFNSSTGSPFITGSGSLLVAASSGPGTFTNPTGITGFSLSGLNVVITATNGQAGDAYYLLESTNLALPITQWTVVATNVLGTAGNYTFNATNVVIPGAAQQFYRLSNTNN
jgi:autotransporter-associated beta strand protein